MPADAPLRSSERSHAVFKSAQALIPGGTNSPLSSADAGALLPLYVAKCTGGHVTDVDGNDYIDFTCARGSLILGHADQRVVVAIDKAAARGFAYGLATESEVRLAELIVARVEGIKLVRLVNSATEAVLGAVRAARAFTGRETVVRFEGCHHGPAEALMGTGTAASLPFNDLPAAKRYFSRSGARSAALLIEPIPARMGLVPPVPGFLAGLRELCDKHGTMLIFDETITGFRVGPAGASALHGVVPDLFCYGAIVGGGVALGAFGGRRDAMIAPIPTAGVYEPGSLGGNALAIAAGITTLQATGEEGFYQALDQLGARLAEGLRAAALAAGAAVHVQRVGSMVATTFAEHPATDWASASASDAGRFQRFRSAMLERGVLMSPSPFDCLFLCAAHTEEDIDRTIELARDCLKA